MGRCGRYIDRETDEARDRIIRGQHWTTSGCYFVDPGGCRCLVGHAEDWYRDMLGKERSGSGHKASRRVYLRYPQLVKRFGLDRIVRACKARAAKANRIALPEPVVERSEEKVGGVV